MYRVVAGNFLDSGRHCRSRRRDESLRQEQPPENYAASHARITSIILSIGNINEAMRTVLVRNSTSPHFRPERIHCWKRGRDLPFPQLRVDEGTRIPFVEREYVPSWASARRRRLRSGVRVRGNAGASCAPGRTRKRPPVRAGV